MILLYLLLLLLLTMFNIGATYYAVKQPKDFDGLDRFFLVGGWSCQILLVLNTDKFFKDYSQCFPI